MRLRLAPLVLLVFAIAPLRADVTVRYNSDFNVGQTAPAGAAANPGLAALQGPMVIRIKGDKVYTSAAKLHTITDLGSSVITYIDSEHKRFATAPAGDVAGVMANAMPRLPQPVAGLAAMLQSDVQSSKTGRTETIHGIRAEEFEYVLNLSMAGAPHLPFSGPAVRLVMQFWRAVR